MKPAANGLHEREARTRVGPASLLLLLLAAIASVPAEASVPRTAAGDACALRAASLAEPSRLARLTASDDVEHFALLADDDLALSLTPWNAADLALESRGREGSFSLHLGVDVFGREPLRGPPSLNEDLCQGDDECLAGTRIGGLGLLEPFAQKAEPELTLGLLPGYEVSTSGLAYGKPLDPWGLAVSVAKSGTIVISDERSPTGGTYRVSREEAESNRALLQKTLIEIGGLSPEESDKFVTEHDLGARTEAERAQAMGALTSGMTERWLKDAARLEAELAVGSALGYGTGKAVGVGVRWGMGRLAGTRAGNFLSTEVWASAPQSVSIAPNGAWTSELDVAPSIVAQRRSSELQRQLSPASRGRTTMSAGVVENPDGTRTVLVGTNERRGYLRRGVTRKPNEEVVAGTGHAESDIVAAAKARGQKVISVGTGRPHCNGCVTAIEDVGGAPAGPRRGY